MRSSLLFTQILLFSTNAIFVSGSIAQGPISQFDPDSLVFIECRDGEGTPVSQGSGVIVSEQGHILTAKHVDPGVSHCYGERGTGAGASVPSRRLIRQRSSEQYDATLFRFVPESSQEFFAPLGFTRLETYHQGKKMTIYGFPNEGTGEFSLREGVISTVIPQNGFIETDALAARGMSGGPAVLNESGALVGLIAGAEFDELTATPSSFKILALQEVATELDIKAHELLVEESSTLIETNTSPLNVLSIGNLGNRRNYTIHNTSTDTIFISHLNVRSPICGIGFQTINVQSTVSADSVVSESVGVNSGALAMGRLTREEELILCDLTDNRVQFLFRPAGDPMIRSDLQAIRQFYGVDGAFYDCEGEIFFYLTRKREQRSQNFACVSYVQMSREYFQEYAQRYPPLQANADFQHN